jgi:hypothetical protein
MTWQFSLDDLEDYLRALRDGKAHELRVAFLTCSLDERIEIVRSNIRMNGIYHSFPREAQLQGRDKQPH